MSFIISTYSSILFIAMRDLNAVLFGMKLMMKAKSLLWDIYRLSATKLEPLRKVLLLLCILFMFY